MGLEFLTIIFAFTVTWIMLGETRKQIATSTKILMDEMRKIRVQLDEIQYKNDTTDGTDLLAELKQKLQRMGEIHDTREGNKDV